MNQRLAAVLTVAVLVMGATVWYFYGGNYNAADSDKATVTESAAPIRNNQDLRKEGKNLESTQVDSSAEIRQNEQDTNLLK